MEKGNLKVRPFDKRRDRKPWLALLDDLCASSTAWEAVYLEHPNFHPNFDFVLEASGGIVGAFGGHLIDTHPKPFWSAEIFGVHPNHQRKGFAKSMLDQTRKELSQQADRILFWTRCDKARSWYEQQSFDLIDEKNLCPLPQAQGELHTLKKGTSQGVSLWAYALTL